MRWRACSHSCPLSLSKEHLARSPAAVCTADRRGSSTHFHYRWTGNFAILNPNCKWSSEIPGIAEHQLVSVPIAKISLFLQCYYTTRSDGPGLFGLTYGHHGDWQPENIKTHISFYDLRRFRETIFTNPGDFRHSPEIITLPSTE